MFIKTRRVQIAIDQTFEGWFEIRIRLFFLPMADEELMNHIIWVCRPYFSQERIERIAVWFGYCKCIVRDGCDESCIPF